MDYQDAHGEHTATGSYADILAELAQAGFREIVCDRTPNGRNIMYDGDHYIVQPQNDNYWINVDSLAAAHNAYARPEDFGS